LFKKKGTNENILINDISILNNSNSNIVYRKKKNIINSKKLTKFNLNNKKTSKYEIKNSYLKSDNNQKNLNGNSSINGKIRKYQRGYNSKDSNINDMQINFHKISKNLEDFKNNKNENVNKLNNNIYYNNYFKNCDEKFSTVGKNFKNIKLNLFKQIQNGIAKKSILDPRHKNSKSNISFYVYVSFILSSKYPKNKYFEKSNKKHCILVKLIFYDLFSLFCCVIYYISIFFISIKSKKPILCDITQNWLGGVFYGDRQNEFYKELKSCNEICSLNDGFWNLKINYFFSKLYMFYPFLIKLNLYICMLYAICKKYHYLYIIFILIYILLHLIIFIFVTSKYESNLISYISLLFFFLSFMESKSSFYFSLIFFSIYTITEGIILFTKHVYPDIIRQTNFAAFLFLIYQYIIILIFNNLMNSKYMKFLPGYLKYSLYIFINSCFEGLKTGFYYVFTLNGFYNLYFTMFLFFDLFLNFLKKYKIFEKCFVRLKNYCCTKMKSKITEVDKMNDIANLESQLFCIINLIFLNNMKFFYFYDSVKFNDCWGTPNIEYFNPNKNSDALVIVLFGKIILTFVLTNFICSKLIKSNFLKIPFFIGFYENFFKFSVNLYAIILIINPSIAYSIFYLVDCYIINKLDNCMVN